jgi:antitoxin Phd
MKNGNKTSEKDDAPESGPARRTPNQRKSQDRAAASKKPAAAGTDRRVQATAREKRPSRKYVRGGVPRNSIVYMSSTDAQNSFGRVLDMVARDGTVLITKRNAAQAVVMSVERYETLTQASASGLDSLTAEFNELLERMQTPEARAGMQDAFRASPDELSRAAVAAAQRDEE